MCTPSGRFKTDTRLCLSMSDFHPETWNPLWSVASILAGLLSFMLEDTPTPGSVETNDVMKREYAARSLEYNLKNATFKKLFAKYADKKYVQPLPKLSASAVPAASAAAAAAATPASAASAAAAVALPASAAAAPAAPTSAAAAAPTAESASAAAAAAAPAAAAPAAAATAPSPAVLADAVAAVSLTDS